MNLPELMWARIVADVITNIAAGWVMVLFAEITLDWIGMATLTVRLSCVTLCMITIRILRAREYGFE